jgi:hypothetical protein
MTRHFYLFLLLYLQMSPASVFSQPTFFTGIARINITPEVPIRMSGYGGRDEPFSGIHDSIFATAIVLEMGDKKMAMVSADVVGFSHDFVDQTLKSIQTRSGIPSENVLVIAAHNHGGPITSVYTKDPTETEIAYFASLQSKLSVVVSEALKNVQPAKIGAGKGRCTMNINRRGRHAEGGIWLGRNPDGICDHEVGIIRIDNEQNEPIGAFLNWPCHATVSGPGNTEITGDWPGAAAHYFSAAAGTMVMVTAGASADINPIYGPNNKFNDIAAIGQLLGEEATTVFKDIKTYRPDQLEMGQASFLAQGKKRSESRMPVVSLVPNDPEMIRVAVLKIGQIALAGVSGELMTEIGLDIKEASGFKNTFVVTHCNGSSGYLCTDKAYEEGGYEPMVSKTMPGTAARIKDAIYTLLLNL